MKSIIACLEKTQITLNLIYNYKCIQTYIHEYILNPRSNVKNLIHLWHAFLAIRYIIIANLHVIKLSRLYSIKSFFDI